MESLTTQRRTAEYSPLEQTARTESPEDVVNRVGELIYGICERRGIALPEDALPLQEVQRKNIPSQKKSRPDYELLSIAGINCLGFYASGDRLCAVFGLLAFSYASFIENKRVTTPARTP